MSLETTCKVLLALFIAAASACVSTELSTGAEHPANPRAPAQPPPPASSALQPDFEPFAAYGVAQGSEAPDHDHGAHGHAEVSTDGGPAVSAPANAASSPPVAESPGEAAAPSEPSTDRASSPSVPEATGSKRASPPQKKKAKKPEYTCPMHPEVRSPDPGRCPKCGMPLVLEKQKAP